MKITIIIEDSKMEDFDLLKWKHKMEQEKRRQEHDIPTPPRIPTPSELREFERLFRESIKQRDTQREIHLPKGAIFV